MRILYLFTSPALKGSSVQQKVIDQIKYLNASGTICRGAFFSGEVDKPTPYSDTVELLPVERPTSRFFLKEAYRKNVDRAMTNYIPEIVHSYDVIYLRYPLASKGLLEITRQFGKKFVLEHQTKEIPEMISFLKGEPFRLKLGYLLYLYEFGARAIAREYYTGRRILREVLGGIAVTSEVSAYEKKRSKNYRCLVVGNGIDFSRFPACEQSDFDGRHLRMFVLVGANTLSPTHGVDRLIKSVRANQSRFHIHLSIFSKNNYRSEKGENFEISYEGFMPNEHLTGKLQGMHFAVGGLASFRKGTFYGSGLKVREYFARGFPIIMASIDEDIDSDPDAKKYTIQVPNVPAPVDFQRFETDILRILSDRERAVKIRAVGERLFSFPVKMQQLKRCLTQLIDNS
jgi:glycosyltransferase involved in cell wall biosynthesis